MTRLAFVFILSLCFLFLRGYGHLYTHTQKIAPCFSPAKLTSVLKKGSVSDSKSNQVISKSSSSGTASDGANATELDDDDDFEFSRKQVEIPNNFIDFFYAPLSADAHHHLIDRLPFCKHFAYKAVDKYIVQRAIRI